MAEPLKEVAIAQGRSITTEAFQALSSRLRQAIQDGGVTSAIPYCAAVATPLTTALGETNQATLKRVSHKPRNPANRANPQEIALIQTYQADLQSGRNPSPTVLWADSQTVRFYAPIVIVTNVCLACHGEPDKDVTLDALLAIRASFPRDEAVGFKMGDIRGLWRVDLTADRLRAVLPPTAGPQQ